MQINEIEMMLSLIANKKIADLTNYLLNERNKYYSELKEEEYTKIAYAAFLKYMCDLKSKPVYSYLKEKTLFNDDKSMFIINKKFEIGKDSCDINESLQSYKRISDMLQNKGIINSKYKELSYTVLQRGVLAYKFKSEYVDYLYAFIGSDVPIYIDTQRPLAYAESDHGVGYILGLKR